MKKFLKILVYLFSVLIILLILVAAGLLTYYQTNYQPTPLPSPVSATPPIRMAATSEGKPVLLPVPKTVIWETGCFPLQQKIEFVSPAEDEAIICKTVEIRMASKWMAKKSGQIKFLRNGSLAEQAYNLTVLPHKIKVEYSSQEGMNNAISTLKELAVQSNHQIPCVRIADQPDLKVRGAMLDISRGKVPTLQTLFGMVDFLADLK